MLSLAEETGNETSTLIDVFVCSLPETISDQFTKFENSVRIIELNNICLALKKVSSV